MRSTSKKVSEPKTSLEEDLKSLQKTVSDLHKSFEGWKQQKPRYNSDSSKPPTRKCFLCGSDKHLKFKCPQNPKNKNVNTDINEQDGNHQAKYVASTSAGLYAEC